jgi:hypothetical protein
MWNLHLAEDFQLLQKKGFLLKFHYKMGELLSVPIIKANIKIKWIIRVCDPSMKASVVLIISYLCENFLPPFPSPTWRRGSAGRRRKQCTMFQVKNRPEENFSQRLAHEETHGHDVTTALSRASNPPSWSSRFEQRGLSVNREPENCINWKITN